MIKTITAYECEVCETAYFDIDDARKCGKGHLDGDKMEVNDYFYKTANEQFPDEILIECSNYSGVLAMYKKVKEDSVEGFGYLYPDPDES